MQERIVVDWEHGPPVTGWVQCLDEGVFAGVILTRDPSSRRLVVFNPSDDALQRQADDWHKRAAEGPVYSDDEAHHRVEYRAAMAAWWAKVVEWAEGRGW